MAGSTEKMPHSISHAVALQKAFRRGCYTSAAGDGLSYFLPYLIRLKFRESNVEAEKTRKAGISRSNRVNWKFTCNSLSQLILIWNWWEGGRGDTERPIYLQWLKELDMNNAQLEFRKNKPWFIYCLSIKCSMMSFRLISECNICHLV